MSRKSLPVSGHTAVATAALMVFVLMFLVAQLPAETQTTLLREGGRSKHSRRSAMVFASL